MLGAPARDYTADVGAREISLFGVAPVKATQILARQGARKPVHHSGRIVGGDEIELHLHRDPHQPDQGQVVGIEHAEGGRWDVAFEVLEAQCEGIAPYALLGRQTGAEQAIEQRRRHGRKC